MAKEDIVHIKNKQNNKMNIIQHKAKAFKRKFLAGTPFAIINIFINNCNLTTHFFSITVTDNDYIYFEIKLLNYVTCN